MKTHVYHAFWFLLALQLKARDVPLEDPFMPRLEPFSPLLNRLRREMPLEDPFMPRLEPFSPLLYRLRREIPLEDPCLPRVEMSASATDTPSPLPSESTWDLPLPP